MLYLHHRPAQPLDRAVEAIWLYEGYCPPHRLERVLPSGTVEWVINLREDRFCCYDPHTMEMSDTQPGTLIAGPRSGFQVIDTAQQSAIMGVHVRPGGLGMLLGMPASEFTDRDVSLEAVWGPRAREVRERLCSAPNPGAKLRTLESMLRQRLDAQRLAHPAVAEALRRLNIPGTAFKVGALAKELGLSSRRFIEVFTQAVGLSPKLYARIRRFQGALQTIHRARVVDWADLAFDWGWYDQAHMIRDFQEFSGLTPGGYRRLHGEFMLHVPVEERGQICPIPPAEQVACSPE